jgi:hypothetical protein
MHQHQPEELDPSYIAVASQQGTGLYEAAPTRRTAPVDSDLYGQVTSRAGTVPYHLQPQYQQPPPPSSSSEARCYNPNLYQPQISAPLPQQQQQQQPAVMAYDAYGQPINGSSMAPPRSTPPASNFVLVDAQYDSELDTLPPPPPPAQHLYAMSADQYEQPYSVDGVYEIPSAFDHVRKGVFLSLRGWIYRLFFCSCCRRRRRFHTRHSRLDGSQAVWTRRYFFSLRVCVYVVLML